MKSHVSCAVRRFLDAPGALSAAVIATTVWATYAAPVRAELPSMAQVERAVLAADAGSGTLQQNWAPVVRLLRDVNEETRDPVLRLIKGHACLAVNKNNESVCLFLSVRTPEDQKQWLEWADGFAKRYPVVPISHYYHADGLARLGQWEHALDCLEFVIQHAGANQHALAFNLRGVVYASRHEFRKARSQFNAAVVSSDRRLADAYANIGALRIDSKEAAAAAVRAFDRVVQELSPEYALALHGRACVRLVIGQSEAAEKDFRLAEQYGRCAVPLFQRNRLRILAYWRGMTEKELFAAIQSGADGGTTLDSSMAGPAFSEYAGHPTQENYNQFLGCYSDLSPGERQDFNNTRMGPAFDANPQLETQTQLHNGMAKAWEDGPARNLSYGLSAMPFLGGPISNLMNERTQRHSEASEGLQDFMGGRAEDVGGLDMNLADIVWDSGEWPFCAYYALMFDGTDVDIPYAHAATAR